MNNKAQFTFYLNTSGILPGQYVTILLKDFYVGNTKLVTGTWQFEVKLDYPNVSKSFLVPASEGVLFEEGTLHDLTLSPIQVDIQFDPYAYSAEDLSEAPAKKVSLQVIMKDGSIIYLGCSNTSVNSDENSSKATFSYEFPKPININDVSSFQIDGRIILIQGLTEQ